MHRLGLIAMLTCAGVLLAQTEMPAGFVRGAMVGWDGTPASGQLTVRAADGSLSSCGYDSRSWFDRAQQSVSVSKLLPGDPVEVLADRQPGSPACYVRIVHVLDPQPPARYSRQTPVKPADPPPRRGDRTLPGVVIRREGAALSIKTRTEKAHYSYAPTQRSLATAFAWTRRRCP